MRRFTVLLFAAGVAVTGCSSSETASSSSSTAPATTSSASAATENQVASVIAGQETDWRKVIDDAAGCRSSWVMQDPDPAEGARRFTCYVQEQTIGLTAQTAIRDLGKLTIPDSMTGLVDETTTVLQSIAHVDLEGVCGTGDEPMTGDACNKALGARMFAYTQLGNVLDKWTPYM